MPIHTRKIAWALCSSVLLISPLSVHAGYVSTNVNGKLSVGYRQSDLNNNEQAPQVGNASFDPDGSYIDVGFVTYPCEDQLYELTLDEFGYDVIDRNSLFLKNSDQFQYGAKFRLSLSGDVLSDLNEGGFSKAIDTRGYASGSPNPTPANFHADVSQYTVFLKTGDLQFEAGKGRDLISQMNQQLGLSNTHLIRSLNLYNGSAQLPSYVSDVSGEVSGSNPYYLGASYATENGSKLAYQRTYTQTPNGMVTAHQMLSSAQLGTDDFAVMLSTAYSTNSPSLYGKMSAVDDLFQPTISANEQAVVGVGLKWGNLNANLATAAQDVSSDESHLDDEIEVQSASLDYTLGDLKFGYSIMHSEHANVDNSSFLNRHISAEYHVSEGLDVAYHRDHYDYDHVRVTPRTEASSAVYSSTRGEGSANTFLMSYTF